MGAVRKAQIVPVLEAVQGLAQTEPDLRLNIIPRHMMEVKDALRTAWKRLAFVQREMAMYSIVGASRLILLLATGLFTIRMEGFVLWDSSRIGWPTRVSLSGLRVLTSQDILPFCAPIA